MTTIKVRAAALALLAVTGCDMETPPPPPFHTGESSFALLPSARWRLPGRLNEISGLARAPDGRFFAHGDEQAIIYEIGPDEGRLLSAFALGDPVLRDDFEDIAAAPNGDLYAVTSGGLVFRFRPGADGARVDAQRFDTRLSETCEVEGAAFDPQSGSLILACKQSYDRAMRSTTALYEWAPGQERATLWREFRERDLAQAAGVENFHPSAIAFDARTDRWLLLAGRERALVEFDNRGRILAARTLERGHRQPEAMALTAEGALLIADEAAGERALLTIYPRADQ
ncbi:MAG: SdiA-regulated domain-containing protein [Hyphomonadaceae bacterium]